MITDNLFETVLVEPARQSGDSLYVVSGYATATMVSRHMQAIKELHKDVRIELVVGMAVQDGLSQKDHNGFQEIAGSSGGMFVCRYVAYRPPVHSKVYAWYSGNLPKVAFTGSANYTQQAFSPHRRESLSKDDAQEARLYFDLVRQDTIDCFDPQVESLITIYSEPEHSIRQGVENGELPAEEEEREPLIAGELAKLPHVKVSLLDNQGRLPQRSGLNWGQRPEYNRERNQAYIRLPQSVARTDFFPPRGEVFTILTDDDKSLICVRAQDEAKAIHTSQNNSILGIYFRYRLGVAEGGLISKNHLDSYGRADVDFYKIDEETFYMDFSVQHG